MSLTSDILLDAYRESNLVALGALPDGAQQIEGMRLLTRLVDSVFGNEVGEKLRDWPIGSSYLYAGWGPEYWQYLEGDIRIIVADGQSHTLTMPPAPENGARIEIIDAGTGFATYPVTLKREAALIAGQAADYVLNTDGAKVTLFYRSDLADWVVMSPLDYDGEFPFPPQHDDAFVGMFATRLNPRYQQTLSDESRASLSRATSQLRAAYRRIKPTAADLAVLRLTGSQPWGWGGGPLSTARFLNGDPF